MSTLRQLGLFLTESCNLACPYCFAANMEGRFMDRQTARRAVELLLSADNAAMQVGITFWGGEPLLRFELLQELVLYAEELAQASGKRLLLAVPTNLTLLSEEMLDFLVAHRVHLSMSLDGAPAAQDLRRLHSGEGSSAMVEHKLEMVRRRFGDDMPPVRMTVSPDTAGDLCDNVRFFLQRGVRQVYFAPVAEAAWSDDDLARYEAQQRALADQWAERLEQGAAPLSFTAWDKALARRELLRRGEVAARTRQVTCGAGTAMVAVDIHGEIYPCHRFVFYDKASRGMALGSVRDGLPDDDARRRAMTLDQARMGRIDQPCETCASAESCYNVCPALNHALCGEIHTMDSRLCALWAAEQRVLDHLERRVQQLPAYRRYVDGYLMKTYGVAGITSSVAALFSRLDESDEDRLADRADEILRRLDRGRKRQR